MKARVQWLDGRAFVGESGSGHAVVMDGAPESGGRNIGVRPMEMMLLGLGGCTAFDVVMILERMREKVTGLDIALEGDRALHEVRQKIQAVEESGDMEQLGHLYEELENLDGYTAEARVATILHGLGFKTEDLQRKVGEFSGGWKMRLNLAKVLGSRADLILLEL